MGAAQSRERVERPRKPKNAQPEFIRISRTDQDLLEAMEAYSSVGLSSDIVEQIVAQNRGEEGISDELARQRQENEQLRQTMAELETKHKAETMTAAVAAATTAATVVKATQSSSSALTDEELIDYKRKEFNESADRVERVFLSRHQPNACAENEKAIVECLASNPDRPLLCQPLINPYKLCIGQSKSKLIRDHHQSMTTTSTAAVH